MTALILPALAGTALFSLDYVRASNKIATLQHAADSAALISARQMAFVRLQDGGSGDADNATLTAIADGMVQGTLSSKHPDVTTSASIVNEDQVRVTLSAKYDSLFGEMGFFGPNPFNVEATARVFGGRNVCMISLGSHRDKPALIMENSAHIDGKNCGIYSGSTKADSISVQDSARIDATFICSAGGYQGPESNFSTEPFTECQQIGDPLENRRAPPFDATCDHDDLTLEGGSHTLEPGTYCGKTDIRDGADVWLNEGIYVFRTGELHVHDTGRLAGTGVGLYFDDKKASFKFMDEGEVDLSAPVTGPMAGILIAAKPLCNAKSNGANCNSGRSFEITSSNVRSLLGTIHLPTDELVIDTTMPVSSEAAFTIVVVGRMDLEQSPSLVLNTDYDDTDVPVPDGFNGEGTLVPQLVR